VVRTTLEALAAVLGGTQSLHTNALDEALGLPTESAARLALRTQQILSEESGVPSTVDPLGGAYEIEHLTDRVEADARAYLDRVEAMGGAIIAVEKGFFQSEIAREAYQIAKAREAKQELVVGVNAFTDGDHGFRLFPDEVGGKRGRGLTISPELERTQKRDLARWKRERDAKRATAARDALGKATEAGKNVMPPLLTALRAGVTLGEVSDTWRELFGEYRAPRTF
jgi:methylmalonyl-CoA mutase N-terminal domain/subunit